MADMLSQPLPQPPVSDAKQASHIASQIARGSIPEHNRCRAKSTAYKDRSSLTAWHRDFCPERLVKTLHLKRI